MPAIARRASSTTALISLISPTAVWYVGTPLATSLIACRRYAPTANIGRASASIWASSPVSAPEKRR
jgi:hypothetical protein